MKPESLSSSQRCETDRTKLPVVKLHVLYLAVLSCSLFGLTSPILVAQDGSPEVEIEDPFGGKFQTSILSFADQSLATAKDKAGIPFERLKGVKFLSAKPLSPKPANFRVTLVDGSIIRCDGVLTSPQATTLIIDAATQNVDPKFVSHIQVGELSAEDTESWDQMLAKESEGDVLAVKRNSGALTRIEGVVLEIGEDSVKFQLGEQVVPVAFEKLAGIKLFRSKSNETETAKGTLQDIYGNHLRFNGLSSKSGRLRVDLACGSAFRLALNEVANIDFAVGNIKFLAEIDPLRLSSQRVFDFPFGAEASNSLLGFQTLPRRRVPGSSVGPSIRLVGSCEATFEIPDGFQKLIGSVTLSPQGSRFTSCDVSILLEGKVLWQKRLTEVNKASQFDLKIIPNQRLKLVSSTSSRVPIGNVVEWIEPTLMK